MAGRRIGNRGIVIIIVAAIFLAFVPPSHNPRAQAVPSSSILSFSLENGMDVILLPLTESTGVSLSMAFRGGAEAQSKSTAGLFSLLEQVIFRGTASSPGEPEPGGALEALDAIAIGGGTERDRFGISLILDSSLTAQGIDTIAYLFSGLRLETALSDPLALEEAKAASLERIQAETGRPEKVFEAAMAKKLFSSGPWRFDLAGSENAIKAATAEGLKALAAAWLVPNNALLVVAGSFSAEETRPQIEKAFSSWKKAADPWKTPFATFPKPGVSRPTLMVFPDASIQKGQALIEMRYRGPDAASNRQAAAEVWAEMVSQPGSRLALALSKGLPKASLPSMISARYLPSRSASWFSVSARVTLAAKENIADTVLSIKEIVRGSEMYAMKTNPSYFTAKDYERAASAIQKRRDDRLDTLNEAGTALVGEWILGGLQWPRQQAARIAAVTQKDMTAFADEYFMKNLEVVALRLEPGDYAARKKSLDAYGFETITPQNAFWWK